MMRARCLTAAAVCFVVTALVPAPAAAQSEVVEYYALDAIGSVRAVFDANGAIQSRRDYGPFGEPITSITADPKMYAGLFRDDESKLEYAQARMYQSRTGRFTAVDPVYAGLFNPQAWNRYGYALNSPMVYVDPEGLNAEAFESTSVPACESYNCELWMQMRLSWLFGGGSGGSGGGRIGGGSSEPGGGGPSRIGAQTPVPPSAPPIFTPDSPSVPPLPTTPPADAPADPRTCSPSPGPVQFIGGGGVFVPLLGIDISGGIYRVPSTGEWGMFSSRGVAVGSAFGAGFQVGQVDSMANFGGSSMTLNMGFGVGAGTAYKDAANQRFTGASFGGAAGIPNVRAGAHASRINTTVLPINRGECQ